jgi:hypothetical protein
MTTNNPNWSEDWSDDWYCCRKCHKTTHNHAMEGWCQKCFNSMEVEKKKIEVARNCLKCDKSFTSYGPGNRRCDICLKKDSSMRYRHRLNINNSQ